MRARFSPPLAVGVVMLLATVGLVYLVVDSQCNQLSHEIRRHERQLAALENERMREQARWDEKQTPEALERAMLEHGLLLRHPTADQVVRLDAAGNLLPGQRSVARFLRNRAAIERVARSGQQPQTP